MREFLSCTCYICVVNCWEPNNICYLTITIKNGWRLAKHVQQNNPITSHLCALHVWSFILTNGWIVMWRKSSRYITLDISQLIFFLIIFLLAKTTTFLKKVEHVLLHHNTILWSVCHISNRPTWMFWWNSNDLRDNMVYHCLMAVSAILSGFAQWNRVWASRVKLCHE